MMREQFYTRVVEKNIPLDYECGDCGAVYGIMSDVVDDSDPSVGIFNSYYWEPAVAVRCPKCGKMNWILLNEDDQKAEDARLQQWMDANAELLWAEHEADEAEYRDWLKSQEEVK